MPNPFSFMTATEILFGRGQAGQAAERIAGLGGRVLLVHGGTSVRSEWLAQDLAQRGSTVERFAVPSEPDMALIEAGMRAAREVGAEGCCQTNANSSRIRQVRGVSGGAERPPLSESGGAVPLVDWAAGEAPFDVEEVVH